MRDAASISRRSSPAMRCESARLCSRNASTTASSSGLVSSVTVVFRLQSCAMKNAPLIAPVLGKCAPNDALNDAPKVLANGRKLRRFLRDCGSSLDPDAVVATDVERFRVDLVMGGAVGSSSSLAVPARTLARVARAMVKGGVDL